MKMFRIEITVEGSREAVDLAASRVGDWVNESICGVRVLQVDTIDSTNEGEVLFGEYFDRESTKMPLIQKLKELPEGVTLETRFDEEDSHIGDVEADHGFDTWPCLDHHLGSEPWDVEYWELSDGRKCIRTWCECRGHTYYVEAL